MGDSEDIREILSRLAKSRLKEIARLLYIRSFGRQEEVL
jgi:hypothetical protein